MSSNGMLTGSSLSAIRGLKKITTTNNLIQRVFVICLIHVVLIPTNTIEQSLLNNNCKAA